MQYVGLRLALKCEELISLLWENLNFFSSSATPRNYVHYATAKQQKLALAIIGIGVLIDASLAETTVSGIATTKKM